MKKWNWDEADELKKQGKTYPEISNIIGIPVQTIKNHYSEANNIKVGEEERKPRVSELDGHFIIESSEQGKPNYYKVRISKDDLRKLKILYCETKLTMPEICREMEIPRRDFYLIKTSFNITHLDTPYLDQDLKEQSPEELANRTLERLKKNYFLKLQEQEIKELRKEVSEYRGKDYLIHKYSELIKEQIKELLATYDGPMIPIRQKLSSGKMLEVSIVDLHLGKLAWNPETGENYDQKIAEKRFMSVIYDIVERSKGLEFEKIIFPIGNDFFNSDNTENETTKGTRQDNDCRWQKMYQKGYEMLIKAIDILTTIAPVESFVVPGNHDGLSSYNAINYVYAWFHNNPNVKINTDPKTRKYIEFGKCLIGFTHGDKEKKRIYGNMQTEARQAWGRTLYQEWHGAHLHSEQVREDLGVIVRNLSSVTGIDAWHYESGYTGAIAKSQSFVWDKEKGLTDIWITVIEPEKRRENKAAGF